MKIIIFVALLAVASADPFFLKKASLKGSPEHSPDSRIIEKKVEVIKPVEIIKEVPVIRNVEVIKEVPVVRTVEKPVEVIKHVPVVRTVVQRVPVPYPVHIERRIPYAVPVQRHIPIPVAPQAPLIRQAPYPQPVEPVPVPEHPLAAKLNHIKGLFHHKAHSVQKRSPIFRKIKNKIHAKKAYIKGKLAAHFG